MGAKVIGVSKDIPTIPSHYKLNNKFYMKNEKFDLSNKKLITKIIKNSKINTIILRFFNVCSSLQIKKKIIEIHGTKVH